MNSRPDDTQDLSGEPIYGLPPDLIVGPEFPDLMSISGPANWGMNALDLDKLRALSKGKGVRVGVVDTGCDDTHPILAGKVVAMRDFTGSPIGAKDRNGHGTHCAGTIGGNDPAISVAYEAELVIAKGLGDGGSGGGRGIADAMQFCADQGCDIISMSLGSSQRDPTIDAKGQELAAKGILIVCAAGNSGERTPDADFPARLPWAISVAAVAENLKVASFSNSGKKINTAGPGVGIVSAKPGGGFVSMSGTSMATPFVAAELACWWAPKKARGEKMPPTPVVQKMLLERSMDIGEAGVDLRTGPGILWPVLLANDLTPDPPLPLAG